MTTRQAKAKLRRKYGWHFTTRATKQGDLYAYRDEVDDLGAEYYDYIDVEHYPYRDEFNIRIGSESDQINSPIVILTFEEYELFSILIEEVKKNRDKLLAYWKEKEKENDK